jgi:hypothetical protein
MGGFSLAPSFQQTNTTTTNAPGGPQAGALNTIYGGATDAYNQTKGLGYNGDFYATPNATQYGAYNQAGNFAAGQGAGVPGAQINAGLPLMAQGFGGAGGALSGLLNYANTDQTQNNIGTANAYANNPYIQQAVDAATYGANRSAAENDIPNLYRSASASGNINSDRAALAQGVVQRGLAENAQNIGASMRNNAWNTGLQTALTQGQMGLGAMSSAGSLGANLGSQGSGMASQGLTDQQNLSKLYEAAGTGLQGLQQTGLDNALAKTQYAQQNPWTALNNYYGLAGQNNWWGTSNANSTQIGMSPIQNQQSPNALSYLGAGLGVLGSVAGMGMPTTALGVGGGTLGGKLLGGLFGK